ncbi:Aspartic proteinase CDR1 [Spatholobus suberectus]|nr:Aspartic proteinase CDR1 [Spatholobus suberectus]
MAFAYEPLNLLLLLSFSTCCLSSTSTISTVKPQRLVSKLVHPGSVHHPHYKPNETAKDRMELDIQHSATRLAYIQARIQGSLVSNDYTASASPSLTGRTILANLSIGQPPIPQLVIIDTASDIFWVMCSPCSNCDNHLGLLFDPSKSSTYSPLCNAPCGSKGCKCDPLPFGITYVDGSSASGTYGRDMVVFETTDEGTSQIFDVVFGCGHNIGYNRDPGYNGLLGLNNAPASLATQIGQKFSYCIGNLADQYYNYNQLILGEGADLEGYSTPFQVHHGFYYVTMEGISVGEKRLDIAPATFEMKEDGTGGVIIDTGSTLTYLVDAVHKLLYKEVRNLLDGSFAQAIIESISWMLCYYGSISRDLAGFPVVTFHFADGADLALDSGSFFHQFNDDVFCMTVGPVSDLDKGSKPSVIGLLAQQSYNMGYDLVDHYVYFQRIDCELLSG